MKIAKIHNFDNIVHEDNSSLVAIWGFFDGCHQGHQALLAKLKQVADELQYQTLVITFNVKPQSVLMKQAMPILFTNETKEAFFATAGIDFYWEIQFNDEIAQTPAPEFVRWLATNSVRAVVVNPKIRYGYQGSGNLELLHASPLEVFTAPDVYDQNNKKISSSYIKDLLTNNQIKQANACLHNDYYTIAGVVIDGIKAGRKLGFPTANLQLSADYALPGLGVYLTLTEVDEQWYRSLTVIINRNNQPLVETYLLDFNTDIYGKTIKVSFLDYLRPHQEFASETALIQQIKADEVQARKFFDTNKISKLAD